MGKLDFLILIVEIFKIQFSIKIGFDENGFIDVKVVRVLRCSIQIYTFVTQLSICGGASKPT